MTVKHNIFAIPRRYMDIASLSKCDPRAKAFIRAWDGKSGGALFGPTKVGKSLAAGIACLRLNKKVESDTWCKWVRADHLTRMVSERNSGERIEELKLARVLVIDEMGYEPWPTAVLEVIGDRHDNERPTLITSGIPQVAFADRYSDATLRRLLEIGDGVLVDFWDNAAEVVVRPEKAEPKPAATREQPRRSPANGPSIDPEKLVRSVPSAKAPERKRVTSEQLDVALSKRDGTFGA